MEVSGRLENLWEIVRSISSGKVMGYGRVGQMLERPVSGLLVGRWMASAPEDVPWWRVIGADGTIKTFKRGPEHGLRQRKLLEEEGIEFEDERVPERFFQPD